MTTALRPPPPPPPRQPPAIVAGTGPTLTARRAKSVPKPTFLEQALPSIQLGKERLELMSLTMIEADMGCKLADLLLYLAEHPNVVSVELQVLS